MHDKKVLPAVSAGGHKLRSTIEEETLSAFTMHSFSARLRAQVLDEVV